MSQEGQDKFIDSLFNGMKWLVFVDIGAYDGVTINNTLYLEREREWLGYNIEANPYVFEQLRKNRPNSVNINVACSDKEGSAEFYCNTGYTEMLSGLVESYKHKDRLDSDINEHGGASEIIQVPTKRFCDIIPEQVIAWLSIDVEGAEFNVIKGIDFSKIFIHVISFENNGDQNSIIEYLSDRNFAKLDCDITVDTFMINRCSKFYKK